jgi:tetratricopeptide (TPR) repeat protein
LAHGGCGDERVSRGNLAKAIVYFDQALRLDPDNGIGFAHYRDVLDSGEAAIDRVLAAQPDNAHAYLWKGHSAKMKSIATKAAEPLHAWLAETNAAIANDRNFAAAYTKKGHYLIATGRASKDFEFLNVALRLDPRDPGRNIWRWQICNAHAHLAQWEQAIEWRQKSAARTRVLLALFRARRRLWLARAFGRRRQRRRPTP